MVAELFVPNAAVLGVSREGLALRQEPFPVCPLRQNLWSPGLLLESDSKLPWASNHGDSGEICQGSDPGCGTEDGQCNSAVLPRGAPEGPGAACVPWDLVRDQLWFPES